MTLHPDYIYMWYKPQQGQTVNLPFVTRMPNGMYVHTINLYGETVGYPDNDISRQYLLTKCSSMRDRKSTRLNSSHTDISRMPSSA